MIDISPDPREAKLPQWAQTKLAQLRNLARDQEAYLNIARNVASEHGSTGLVTVDHYGYADPAFPLRDKAVVVFKLDDGTEVACRLRWEGDHYFLDINSSMGGMNVVPRSSNSIYIEGR